MVFAFPHFLGFGFPIPLQPPFFPFILQVLGGRFTWLETTKFRQALFSQAHLSHSTVLGNVLASNQISWGNVLTLEVI